MRLEQVVTTESVIRLEGVFDGIVARRLERVLVAASPQARIRLDLTQVREFHDLALAVLGHALTRAQARVTLRGLREHQLRVLRHFGGDAGSRADGVFSDET